MGDISTSKLITDKFDEVNDLTNAYNDILSRLLDKHAPGKNKNSD